MADIFGKTEVLPSWLRDDGGERFARGFQIGSSAARGAAEDQRANRRLTIEEDQAEARKMMNQTALEGARLKVDEEKAFAADTPELQKLGMAFQNASTLPELDAARRAANLKTPKGRQAVDLMWTARQGQIAKAELSTFGSRMEVKHAMFLFNEARDWTPEERKAAVIETGFEVAPEQTLKSVLPAEIRANATQSIGADPSVTTIDTDAEGNPLPKPITVFNPGGRGVPKVIVPAKDLEAEQQRKLDLIKARAKANEETTQNRNALSIAWRDYNKTAEDPTATPALKEQKFNLLQVQARNNKHEAVVGDDGKVKLELGIGPGLRDKLQSGISASSQALEYLDSLSPEKIEKSFGIGPAARDLAQRVGGANVGLGHTPEMVEVAQTLAAIQPLVRKGIQSEAGAVTEGDVARAESLMANFTKNSPAQAKQKLAQLKTIFQQSQNRQTGAIKKAPSVQKEAVLVTPIAFETPAEAEAAGLPPGTRITIGGRQAVVE